MTPTWNTLQILKMILLKIFIEIEKSLQCEDAGYKTLCIMYIHA